MTSSMAVESLLRAAWVAWTLPLVAALFQIDAVRRFALHHFVGRGKIMGSSFTNFSVPQKYFSHFYVVGFIFNSILIVGLYAYSSSLGVGVNGDDDHNIRIKIKMNGIWQSILLLVLFEAQLLGRIVESIFIFKYSPTARMHVVSYLLSFYYYSAVSVSLCCKYCVEALEHAKNMIAEYLVGAVVDVDGKSADMNMNIWGGIVNPVLQLQWYAWIGAAFFFWGWIHQRRCHAILGSIRKNRKADEYAIPEGDWFQYVSSAHYLAEIVIYGGFVVASGFSDLTIWLLFIFVVANLAVTADETHKWYHRKFDKYPKNRYAIIPFIY